MGTSLPPVGVRFQAQGVEQVAGAFTQLQTKAAATGNATSLAFTTASGRVSAFGRQSVTALNATGFAVSQLASTGQVGFRSLAASAAGFASFFGPAGLIAAGVVSLGLVLGDFWQRQRKEIEETKRATDALITAAASRRERDDPVGVSEERLSAATAAIETNRKAMADLFDVTKRTVQLREGTFVRPVDEGALARLTADRTRLLQAEAEALRQLNDARAKATKGLSEIKVTATTPEAELKKLADTLSGLAKLDALRFADVKRLAEIEVQLQAELARSNITLERRLELLQQLAQITPIVARANKAAALVDADLGRPQIGAASTRPTAPTTLPQPNIPAPKLPPLPEFDPYQEQLAQGLANAITVGMTQGFAQGFAQGGIAEGFRQMASSILSGFGSIFTQIGQQVIAGSVLIQKAVLAISTLNPWAALAAGIALTVLGSALGGRGGGGGFSSGAVSGGLTAAQTIDIRRLIVDPNLRRPITERPLPAPVEVVGIDTQRVQKAISLSRNRYMQRGG